MLKRIFDIFFSLCGLIILSPLFLIILLLIRIESKGNPLFKQLRIGKDGAPFYMYKFRSMRLHAEKSGFITVGDNDARITSIGQFIRKYKIDELPQLINVFLGEMSVVGPRPEVARYVELYNLEQKNVLSVKPGITDYASIAYSNENELLGKSPDPETTYIHEIMPVKLQLNLKYIAEQGMITDLRIIIKTIVKIIGF
jgi:lipopolysaccharide/colanic/teichoic acid biosynthesis glycosyltransferase